MRKIGIGLLAFALVLAGAYLVWQVTQKTVTIVIDGTSRVLTTHAFTVGELLSSAKIPVAAQDRLVPPSSSGFQDNAIIYLDHAVQCLIKADGKYHSILTAERLPSTLLALASIRLLSGDQVLLNGSPVPVDKPLTRGDSCNLDIYRSVTTNLLDGSAIQKINSTSASLGQALWAAGVKIQAGDWFSPSFETELSQAGNDISLKAELRRSRQVTVQISNTIKLLNSAATTVGEILAENNLSPQGLDFTVPAEDLPVPANGKIKLVRVREAVVLEETPLPFETIYQTTNDVELDTRKDLQLGVYGLKVRRVRVRYEDGKEVSRTAENEWVASPPKAHIIGYGTKVVMHTLSTPSGVITYWRVLQFYATSYHPSTGGSNETASGLKLKKGIVGVDRRYIPFGTRMYIPGYGFAEAADTGHYTGRWIDLGYSDSDYVSWHQWVTVYFLWPPPAFIPYTIPPPASY